MTDTILFVKETKTCHYVMVIHTPRLCGERGFKTRLEQRDEAFIRCREVLSDEAALAAVDKSLPETPYPTQRRTRNPILGAPPTLPTISAAEETAEADGRKSAVSPLAERAILQAIEALLVAGGASGGSTKGGSQQQQQQHHQAEGTGESSGVHVTPGKDGEVIIEFFDAADGENVGRLEEIIDSFLAESSGNYQRLQDILRSAGHVIDGANQQQSQGGERGQVDEDGAETRKQKKDEDARKLQRHEEL